MLRRKMSEEQALRKYDPMLHKIAWNFHYTTGFDVEELYSEACLAFLSAVRTYDPAKGELGTRIWVVVTNRLRSFLKKSGVKPLPVYDAETFDIADSQSEIEAKESFDEILSRLSSEAKDLVQIVLSSPEEFVKESSRATRGALTQLLRGKGWSVGKISRCFHEIKSVLSV